MVLKALLFGIDGLISNINQINYFVWQKVLQEYGYKLTYQDYLQLFLFEHAPNLLIVLLPYCTIDEHTTIVKAKEDAFLQLISEMDSSQLHLAPGLLQFISSCQGTDTTIVAVSDLPIKQTTALLEKLHLDQLFTCVISSSGLKKCKPNPLVYETTVEKMELNKDELLVFEGTVEGIISAKRAGLNVIGLKPELTDTNDFVRNEQRKENTLQMIEENAKCVLNDFIDLKYEYLEYM